MNKSTFCLETKKRERERAKKLNSFSLTYITKCHIFN